MRPTTRSDLTALYAGYDSFMHHGTLGFSDSLSPYFFLSFFSCGGIGQLGGAR